MHARHWIVTSIASTSVFLSSPIWAEVGPNVQLNMDTLLHSHAETSCATSILDPDVMVVGCNDDSGDTWQNRKVHYFRTSDGGQTWHSSLIARGEADCSRAGDPSVCSDAAGRFYATYVCRPCGYYSRVYVHRSDDGGISWTAPRVAQSFGYGQALDKPWAACDLSPSSPYVNNLYVFWTFYGNIEFKRSTDYGETFADIYYFGPGRQPCPAVGPDGEIYLVATSQDYDTLLFRRSLDGGTTWTAGLALGRQSSVPCQSYWFNSCPSMAVDLTGGSRNGWIYISYAIGMLGGSGGVFVRHSTDQGTTWSDSFRVSDINEYRQWFPWLTVHPQTGDVAVSWIDKRDGFPSCGYYSYASLSTDGGETWSLNIALSESLSVPDDFETYTWGDYTGVTWSNLGFLSAWPDFRSGIRSDVYACWWNIGFEFEMTSPIANDTVFFGVVDTVKWNLRYAPDSLSIEVDREYPSGQWERLATIRSRDREWPWLVSGDLSDHARLRLIADSYPTFGDTTSGDFTIALAVPTRLTAYRVGNDIRLRWQSASAPYYRIYSAASPDGPFDTYIGATTGTGFTDWGAVSESAKFYIVRAADRP